MNLRKLLFLLSLPVLSAGAAEHYDDFADGKSIPSYRFWYPSGQSGKAEFAPETGHTQPGSVRISGCMRAGFTATLPLGADDTGLYRFSAWAKAEDPGMATFALNLWPAIRGRGEVTRLAVRTLAMPLSTDWEYLELYFRVPAGMKYHGGILTALVGQVLISNFSGKVYLDDIRIGKVSPNFPYSENFTEPSASAAWGLFGSSGLEGVSEVRRIEEGCGDPGALTISYRSGQSGYGAAPRQPVSADRFTGGKAWTLELSVKQSGGAVAVLVVEQYDKNGKLLETATGVPLSAADDYRMASLPFTLRPECAGVRPAAVNMGKGTVTIDHVTIRPADGAEKTMLARQRKAPLWSIVYPADFFAHIDRKTPAVKLLAGRTNFILLMLAGDKTVPGDTIVDITLPKEVELIACQFSTYGPVIPFRVLPSACPDTKRVRITNPYNWGRYMMKNNPNHYSGLELVLRAADKPGFTGALEVNLTLGGKPGEARKLPLEILAPAPAAPQLDWFSVGCWGFNSVHVIDPAAHKELLRSMVASGLRHGAVHASQSYASKRTVKTGFQPGILIHSPEYAPIYKNPPRRTLADGREVKSNVALGAALNDPALRREYRNYLASCVKLLPPTGRAFANIDIEFWSTGICTQSCFHPTTIAAFREFAKIPAGEALDAKIILRQYPKQWVAFRNDVTVRLHRMVRDLLHELRPGTLLCAYDYTLKLDGTPQDTYLKTVPTDSLRYDRQDVIDAHLVSYYSIEGVSFLDHIDCDVRTFRKPVYGVPYLTEALPSVQMPTWSYHHPSVPEVRLEVLAAAASGAAGLSYFTGVAVDGERLNAINEGLNAVGRYADYYHRGKRVDRTVKLAGLTPDIRYRVHELNGKKLLTIFNCGRSDAAVTLPGDEKLTVKAMDFAQKEL